ncbi:hypothetical protein ACQB60_02755 [Actinomycetota bacterium Odt1-20B]
MSKPNTRRLDYAIQQTRRELAAVQKRELWALNGSEARAALSAAAGGSLKVARGKSGVRGEHKVEDTWSSAETRLNAELTALETERQKAVNEAAADKAAKTAQRSSRWW